jgi:hypothetical protein
MKSFMKRSQNVPVSLSKMVLAKQFCAICLLRLVKGAPKASGVDWQNSLISPSGFLLVVSHLLNIFSSQHFILVSITLITLNKLLII